MSLEWQHHILQDSPCLNQKNYKITNFDIYLVLYNV